jgi:hypothetical protein
VAGPHECSSTTTFFDFDVFEDVGTSFSWTDNGNDSLFEDFDCQVFCNTVPANFMFLHVHRLREISQSNGIATDNTILNPTRSMRSPRKKGEGAPYDLEVELQE